MPGESGSWSPLRPLLKRRSDLARVTDGQVPPLFLPPPLLLLRVRLVPPHTGFLSSGGRPLDWYFHNVPGVFVFHKNILIGWLRSELSIVGLGLVLIDGRLVPHLVGGGDGWVGVSREPLAGAGGRGGPDPGEGLLVDPGAGSGVRRGGQRGAHPGRESPAGASGSQGGAVAELVHGVLDPALDVLPDLDDAGPPALRSLGLGHVLKVRNFKLIDFPTNYVLILILRFVPCVVVLSVQMWSELTTLRSSLEISWNELVLFIIVLLIFLKMSLLSRILAIIMIRVVPGVNPNLRH